MKIAIDTHTHSVASGHAYSTIDELARGARRRGLAGFVLTDHGPGMPGATHAYHFGNLRILPERIRGIRMYHGIEANIMDPSGAIDLEPYILARLDFVMAGFHEICIKSRSREENTETLLAAMANPYVDAISHPGNPAFPVDFDAVVRAAVDNGTALELNDSSFRVRRGSAANCLDLARRCVEAGAFLVCGSDAHYWRDVGRFASVRSILKEAKVPKELVINRSHAAFDAYAKDRKARRERLIAT